jgi:hypothetical protein
LFSGAQQGPGEEFSAQTSVPSVRGKNAPQGQEKQHTNARSFDSAIGSLREPIAPLRMTMGKGSGQVITVSLETVKIVDSLPPLGLQ